MHLDGGVTSTSLLGKQVQQSQRAEPYRTGGNTPQTPQSPHHMVHPHQHSHSLEMGSSRKNKIAGIFIFTSLEVTFSRSLLIMMLRSLALMSRSVRSLSVGLKRGIRRECLQAGNKQSASHTVQRSAKDLH